MFRLFTVLMVIVVCSAAVYADAKLNILTFVTSNDHTIFRNSRNELNQMEKFGSTGEIGIYYEISEWPQGDANPSGGNSWLERSNWSSRRNGNQYIPTVGGRDYVEAKRWRYQVAKDDNTDRISSVPASRDVEYKHDAIHENLIDFVKWVHENHPADMYMLILKGHGNGSLGGSGHVTNADVGKALEGLAQHVTATLRESAPAVAERLKIVAFSSCLMQTAAVAYQCSKNGVESILGSSVPTYGIDYEKFLNRLKENTADGDFSVRKVSESYIQGFDDYVRSLNYKDLIISAVNAKKLKNDMGTNKDIKKLLNKFVTDFLTESPRQNISEDGNVTGNRFWEGIRHAVAKAQKFDASFYQLLDMVDFFEQIKNDNAFAGTQTKRNAEAILAEIKNPSATGNTYSTDKVIMKYKIFDSNRHYTDSVELDNAKGLSLLMPADTFVANIKDGKTKDNIRNAFKEGHPERVIAVNDDGSLNYFSRGIKYMTGTFKDLDMAKSNTTAADDKNNWYYFIEKYKEYADTYVTNIAERIIVKFQNVTEGSGKTSWTGHINSEERSGISHKEEFH